MHELFTGRPHTSTSARLRYVFPPGRYTMKYRPTALHVKEITSGSPAGTVKQFVLPAPLYVVCVPTQTWAPENRPE